MLEGKYGPSNTSLYNLYLENKEAALAEKFRRSSSNLLDRGRAFMYTASKSANGTAYGSFKYITQESLVGRKYEIEYFDGGISLLFTDVIYDPRTYTDIPIQEVAK